MNTALRIEIAMKVMNMTEIAFRRRFERSRISRPTRWMFADISIILPGDEWTAIEATFISVMSRKFTVMPPIKIMNVFLGSKARRGWPYPDYDYLGRTREWIAELEDLKSGLSFPVEFVNETASTMDDVRRIEKEMEDVDAILVYILTSESTRFTYLASKAIAQFGYDHIHKYGGYDVPTIYVVDLYGGDISALPLVEDLKNIGKKFLMISSSRTSDIARALKCIYTLKMLRNSRVLLITKREANPAKYLSPEYISRIKEKFGTDVRYVDYTDVLKLYNEVDEEEAEKLAKKIFEGAREIREPSFEDLVKATKMYYALKKLMSENNANAVAIDCLGWLEYDKTPMPMTPCIALSLLNSEGFVAACEADLHSAITMLIFRYLAGEPSFISDPVIDTARNVVIHCHCTAPIKFGRRDNPYILRSHSDSGWGVGIQVLVEKGIEVTVAKIIRGLEEMIASTGKVSGNVDVDRGCRTKIEVEVKDAEKYLYGFRGGLHRVLAAGDHLKELEMLGKLIGYKLTLEGE